MEIQGLIQTGERLSKSVVSSHVMRVAALCGVMLFSTACLKEQSRWTSGKYALGKLPDDICMVGGVPRIINVNSESAGGVSLVYVRTNGDIVLKRWDAPPLRPWELSEIGEFYWTGGNCPESG